MVDTLVLAGENETICLY